MKAMLEKLGATDSATVSAVDVDINGDSKDYFRMKTRKLLVYQV